MLCEWLFAMSSYSWLTCSLITSPKININVRNNDYQRIERWMNDFISLRSSNIYNSNFPYICFITSVGIQIPWRKHGLPVTKIDHCRTILVSLSRCLQLIWCFALRIAQVNSSWTYMYEEKSYEGKAFIKSSPSFETSFSNDTTSHWSSSDKTPLVPIFKENVCSSEFWTVTFIKHEDLIHVTRFFSFFFI